MRNNEEVLSRGLLLFMSIASGVTVANIYYIQPLLNDIAIYFRVSASMAALMSTLTQIGYACGLFFILPIADIYNRKKIILLMLGLSAVSLLCLTLSEIYTVSCIVCLILGAVSIVPQLLIPMGAQMSKRSERGKNIGIIMSGLLTGILLSRVISGLLSSSYGWKSIYMLAMIGMLLIMVMTIKILPDIPKNNNITYRSSLCSLFTLPYKYSVLKNAAINGALLFAIFSGFWTVLTFHLSGKPFYFHTETIGLFGLLGVAGALLAPVAGRMTDRKGASFTITLHLSIIALSILISILFGSYLIGIMTCIVLMNYGVQCCNVANQGRIQSLSDIERNRITSVYMVCFFLGGSVGSFLGTMIYGWFQWIGFNVMETVLIIIALFLHLNVGKSSEIHR